MKFSNLVCNGLGACLLVLAGHAGGAAATDCTKLEDAAERLACFDRQFPREEPAQPARAAPAPEVETKSVPGQADNSRQAVADEAAAAVASETAPTARREAEPAEATDGNGRTFLGDEVVNLTTSIKAIRKGEKQKMVFLLANDEIWMQSTPRPLPFKEGDTVTIKNAFFGGYFMRAEKGTGTRVQRIE